MHILLVSGSTRARSSNTAALRTAALLAPPELRTELYPGLAGLPAFNPDDEREPLPPPAAGLRAAIDRADGVLFCAPEYAGALPGSLKNLLDWTVGAVPGLYRKPVAWLNVAAPSRGEGAVAELALVLGYVNAAVVEPACVRLPVPPGSVDADGLVADPDFRAGLRAVLARFAAGVRQRSDR